MVERLKTQEPAEGILKRHDFGDSKYYQIVCSCGQEYHDHNVEVEADETGVNINIDVTLKTDYWTETAKPCYSMDNEWLEEFDWAWKSIFNSLVRKIKLTWELWTTGAITAQTTISMSEQQTLNYAKTLENAILDVKHFRDERRWKGDLQNRIAKKLAEESDCV